MNQSKRIPIKYNYNITNKQLYTKNNLINISRIKQMLYEGSLIQKKQLITIIKQFHNIIKSQPNIVKVNDPVIIVGDIHGQFFDLIKVLALFSQEKINSQKYIDLSLSTIRRQNTFVFLGDYVDRGIMAIEVMSMLMLMKIASPKNVIMLRGNHESRIMAQLYNFKQQCNQKYGQEVYTMFMDAFDALPIACIVNQKFFCVHGGITDKLKTIDQIQKLPRISQIPLTGPHCDFIWSDPTPVPSGKLKAKSIFNDSRQCSIFFGADLADQFLKTNKLQTIIRGHQVFQQGYKSYNWLNKQFPQAITVFSAPNYCNSYGNKGTVMRIDNDKVKIRQFNQEIPENYRLADKLEVFSWSLEYILKTINTFSSSMMDRICELYIGDLVNETEERKLQAFLYYYKQNADKINKKVEKPQINNVNNDKKQKLSLREIEEIQKNKPHNQKQQKQFLFKRSQQYFKQAHKIPEVNKFKNNNFRSTG